MKVLAKGSRVPDVQYRTVLYCDVLYFTVQYRAVLYCTVLWANPDTVKGRLEEGSRTWAVRWRRGAGPPGLRRGSGGTSSPPRSAPRCWPPGSGGGVPRLHLHTNTVRFISSSSSQPHRAPRPHVEQHLLPRGETFRRK